VRSSREIHLFDGSEPFTRRGLPTGHTVLDFWRWSASELMGNTMRGLVAEFLGQPRLAHRWMFPGASGIPMMC
jgi:hypothetical protein